MKTMSPKPKILRILNRFNVGGPVQNVALLTKFLEDDYETLLIGGDAEGNEESSLYVLEKYGIKPQLIKEMQRSINPLQDVKAYFKVRKIIREFKPDIVHTHASKAGAIGRLAAKHEKVSVVVHTFHGHVFHSYFGKLKTSIFKTIERYLARQSDLIIAISDKLNNELVLEHKIAPESKVKTVSLGFDLDPFTSHTEDKRKGYREKWNIDADTIAIGIVGRMVPVKNHQLLIDAAEIIRRSTQAKVRYVLVGDGESCEEIKQSILEKGFDFTYKTAGEGTENFILTSWEKDTPSVYAGLDIVCLSSFNEGTPVSLIEAQASERPIVSTRVGGIENVVLENKSALLTAIDTNEFAEALLKLIENKELREEMKGAGKEFSLSKFHYSRLVNDFREVYNDLLKKNKGLEKVSETEIYS